MKTPLQTVAAAIVMTFAGHALADTQTIDFQSAAVGTPLEGMSIGNAVFSVASGDSAAAIWDSGESLSLLSGHAALGGAATGQSFVLRIDFGLPVTDFNVNFGTTAHSIIAPKLQMSAWNEQGDLIFQTVDAATDLPSPLGYGAAASLDTTDAITAIELSVTVFQAFDVFFDDLSFDVPVSASHPVVWDAEYDLIIEEAPLAITLEGVDPDEAPQPIVFTITQLPASGAALKDAETGLAIDPLDLPYTLASHGRDVIYTPAPGFTGADAFSFVADDGGVAPDGGPSAQAAVTINVAYEQLKITTSAIPNGAAGQHFSLQFETPTIQPQQQWSASLDEEYFVMQGGHDFEAPTVATPDYIAPTVIELPFTFSYYGELFDEVLLCHEGLLSLGSPTFCQGETPFYDYTQYKVIAPLWDDHSTSFSCNQGVWIEQGTTDDSRSQGYISFQWRTGIWWSSSPLPPCIYPGYHRVECTLFEDGSFRYDYGSGPDINTNFFFEPYVAISYGDGERYQRWYPGSADLNDAESVRWTPPGLPAGMSMSADGLLSGTPAETGEYDLLVHVRGLETGERDTVALHWIVEPAPCPADFTGNGSVDSDDLFQLLGAWGSCVECPADLTGDGLVDSDDLFELLGQWGACG
jgi:hypothetical protein